MCRTCSGCCERELEVQTIGGWALVSIATNRPKDGLHCFVVYDGAYHKIPLDNRQWTHLSVLSDREDYAMTSIAIVAGECWFPIDDGASENLRCLGVMISDVALGGHKYRDENTWEWIKRLTGPSIVERDMVQAGMECRRSLLDRQTAGRVLFLTKCADGHRASRLKSRIGGFRMVAVDACGPPLWASIAGVDCGLSR